MKITHVLWGLRYGGAETMITDIANLQSEDNDVSVLLINNDIDEDLLSALKPSIRVIRLNRPLKSCNPLYIIRLNLFILMSDADIIHFHQDNIIRYLFIHKLKKNLCLTVHDLQLDIKEVRQYNFVFAISAAVRKNLENKTGIEAPIVWNGIDTARFFQKMKKNNKIFKIIQTGRLFHRHKGQHLTLEALSILVYKYGFTNVHLDITGWGPSEEYLRQLAENLKISEYVTFTGVKSKDYLREHLADYDLLVQPSLWEGFGLTVCEAMCAMTPVLTSDVEGLKVFAGEDVTKFTFHSGDVEDYASKLFEIINLPEAEREQIAQNARDFAVKNFDISTTVKNYQIEYEKIKKKLRKRI
ncbi:MAG: glycosyltransferase family 4 protein [Dysgonamonadaceae bacterium]|jgi:glycosyltransferase involved in cell wall biosynthesis|nr:glycosyltransferase family 4 protein [Dysgonamonadaceae bacterium]